MATQYGKPRRLDKDRKPIKPGSLADRRDPEQKPKEPDPNPPEDVVRKFHTKAAVDTSPKDIHHTVGVEANQAASGSHTHRGGDSKLLFEGMSIVGSKSTDAATVLSSIISLLVALGAKDNTT